MNTGHPPRLVVLPLLAAAVLAGAVGRAGAQSRPGSIYDPDRGPISLIGNKIARRPGDLVTVIIEESQNINNEESADLLKSSSLDYELTSFDIKPNFFSTLPDWSSSSQDEFKGTGNYKKKDKFQARLTAIVQDVLPNGNLVISGRREIRIDNETRLIEFMGVVRRYDVRADNSVTSELVADARVSYVGEGPLTSTTNRQGLNRIVHDWLAWLWPF
jgi:flagellar L-ring protein precursor FlgH